jgi:hypothetical protein
VRVYHAETGKPQGIISSGLEVDSTSGWIEIPYGVRAYQRSDGEHLVFVEEDGYAKIMMYRWDGETNDNQTRVDDTDSAVTYEGAWETQTISPANPSFVSTYNSTLHETSTAGASAKYSFSGSSIALRGRRMFDHGGTADVFIDGTFQQTVSYGYPSGGDWRVIFSKTGLDPGRHTIEVVCKGGGSINVDAFQYTSASA